MKTSSALLIFFLLSYMNILAQESQSKSNSWDDLKKSFISEKRFILKMQNEEDTDFMPLFESTGTLLGRDNVKYEIKNRNVHINMNTKKALLTVYTQLPKEIKERFILDVKKPEGMYLIDRQPTLTTRKKSNESSTASTQSKQKNAYEQAEEEVAKYDSKKDTTEKRSVWQQHVDYNEEQRARNFKLNRGRFDYENPKDYRISTDALKGDNFIEYKINGKPFHIYSGGKNSVSTLTGRTGGSYEYTFIDNNNHKRLFIEFTNPAQHPVIRKFDFTMPSRKTITVDSYATYEDGDLFFTFDLKLPGLNNSYIYHATHTISTLPDTESNIKAGFFEILYFEPGMGGIIEAKFNLVIKGGTDLNGKNHPDILITDGFLRARMKH